MARARTGSGKSGGGSPQTRTARSRTGRRPGDSGARDDILDAALSLFAAKGYDGASVRAIAAAAGVDPALVRHYFGGKDRLFVAAVLERAGVAERAAAILAGQGAESGLGRGEAIARGYLGLWEDPQVQPVVIAAVRSVVGENGPREALGEAVASVFVEALDGVAPPLPVLALLGTQLLGVATARYIVRIPQLTGLSVEEIAARLGPGIDALLAQEG